MATGLSIARETQVFTNSWRRGRLAALIGVCTTGIVVAAGVSATAAVAHPRVPAQARAAVPWAKVGPGWELVRAAGAHSSTLYLVGPNGAKYTLHTWPGSILPGTLVDWSGDKARAMFFDDVTGRVTQLNVMTGKINTFTLTGQSSPVAYSQPHGLNIVAVRDNGSSFTLARYSLTGKLQKVLLSDKWAEGAVYAPNGATLAVPGSTGVRLVSNSGGVIRNLTVPGTAPRVGCGAVRWWDSRTILADCFATGSGAPRLWLVPASGARPAALTPQRTSGRDLGDIAAWRLSSGLYLQSLGACGTLEINKQAANGSVTAVNVPGTFNTHNAILTANGPRLLIDPSDACQGGSGLLWFNPGTRAVQWLFRFVPHTLLDVVPFDSIENGPAI
jgi:TolB protein